MHPDRRRRGRAIRKQRRAPRFGTVSVRLTADTSTFDRVTTGATNAIATAAAAFRQLSDSIDTLMQNFALEARFWALTAPYFPSSATFERLDMSTVSITAPASAPDDLKDHLCTFAAELNEEGITTTLDFIRTCIACGCTDDQACFLGCYWATPDANLCSNCDTPDNRARLEPPCSAAARPTLPRILDAETPTTATEQNR